jgi:hypothetical protein
MVPANTETDNLGEIGIVGKSDNPRKAFLHYVGFSRDPFAQPVAEQEYGFSGEDTFNVQEAAASYHDSKPTSVSSNLYPPTALFTPRSFYVDPLFSDRREGSTFDRLRTDGHAFIFGHPGTGKSTLRLALEAHLRGRPDGTLAVTYEPGRAVEREIGLLEKETAAESEEASAAAIRDATLQELAHELTVDLFIQIVEQFSSREAPPTSRQNRWLCNLILLAAPRLRGIIEKLSMGKEPASVWGFAELWRNLDRPIVRPVVRSKPMADWLGNLRAQRKEINPEMPTAIELWNMAVYVADMWGFGRIYILMDGLDTWWRKPADMLKLLNPILSMMPEFFDQQISLKCFLTLELKDVVINHYSVTSFSKNQLRFIVLQWSPGRLQAMLRERYRAGGSRRMSIADLVVPELREQIDTMLIEEAQGSPRRLLILMHELINAHIARGEYREPITLSEWQQAVMMADKLSPVDLKMKVAAENPGRNM